ncbi:Vanillate O-demethylase oxygenase subunit [Heracleum sosnowskyi]|uniref:Vanillate O-demethylase oxygenase subunit n=1 Tax=Heracleum sosnowskyi TaxID=360622 RepID=A0AAD8J5E1_9APIA|nr:Vanillate O-demethylase oxygenase subunit [Heracleum sosnowskyi]
MSSGTVNFPAILVTVTCNPRRCVRTPLSGRERKDLSEQPPRFRAQESTFPYEHSIGRLRVRRGSLLCLHTRLPFSESSAGPPTTSLRPEGFIAQKRRDAGAAPEEGSPTNARCKAPHLIKIILAYSPKKERADPIEDESEVQQGHFCPPPFSRSRTWTLPLIQLPASKQLAFLYKEWKCG